MICLSGQKKFERILKQPNTASDAYRLALSLFFVAMLSPFQPQSHCFGKRVAADLTSALQGQGEGKEIPGQGTGYVQVGLEERPQEHLGCQWYWGGVGSQGLHPGSEGHICSGKITVCNQNFGQCGLD